MEHAIWTEKYRPTTFSEVKGQEDIVSRVEAFVSQKNMPHLMFAGPPGVGKCVTGDTPILAGDGTVMPIELAYRKNLNHVASLDHKGKISKRRIAYFFKGRADQLVSVKTRSGKRLNSTFDHPFLTLEEGSLKWKQASKLSEGDLVASPSSLCVEEQQYSFPYDHIPGLWANLSEKIEVRPSDLHEGTRKKILLYLEQHDKATTQEMSKHLNLSRGTVVWAVDSLSDQELVVKHGKNPYTATLVCKTVRTPKAPLQCVFPDRNHLVETIFFRPNLRKRSSSIKPFWNLTPQLLEWVAILLGDGHIAGSKIQFINKNRSFISYFRSLTERLFGPVIWNEEIRRGVTHLSIRKARTLSVLLEHFFGIPSKRKKVDIIEVPLFVYTAPRACVAAFLRGYFETEGCFYRGSIEFSTASRKMLYGIQYLLYRFGILCSVRERKNHWSLTVSGAESVSHFRDLVCPLFKKISYHKQENTNIDSMDIASGKVKRILRMLGIRHKEIGQKERVDGLFQKRSGSRKRVQLLYLRLCEVARERMAQGLEALGMLNDIPEGFDQEKSFLLGSLNTSSRRSAIAGDSGIRYDRIKEYVDGKREPFLSSYLKILKSMRSLKDSGHDREYTRILGMLALRQKVSSTLQLFNISFQEIASHVPASTATINSYFSSSGLRCSSLQHFSTVLSCVREILSSRIMDADLIADLEDIDFLSQAELTWDAIEDIEVIAGGPVYDLNVEETHNFIGGHGPLVLHNSTLSLVVAKQLFGDSWRQNFLELNASDTRGIDTIREDVKNFARTRALGEVPFKIIFLDEADALTREAQQALRRTMENYTKTTRFILSCNYSSKIIDPVQSRCAVFRFKPLSSSELQAVVDRIVADEGVSITPGARDSLIAISEGDCRRVATLLQGCAAMSKDIDEKLVHSFASVADPSEVEEVLQLALANKFVEAREKLLDVMLRYGLSGIDMIKQIQKRVLDLEIENRAKMQLYADCGETEFRLTEGSDEYVQLESLLAKFVLAGSQ